MSRIWWGATWVTQAVLPAFRTRGSGHLLQTSSRLGVMALPNRGLHSASKFAVEGFSDALAQEVAGFGIHVPLIEPQGYATDWAGSSAVHGRGHPGDRGHGRPAAACPARPRRRRVRPGRVRQATRRVGVHPRTHGACRQPVIRRQTTPAVSWRLTRPNTRPTGCCRTFAVCPRRLLRGGRDVARPDPRFTAVSP